jgi:hypothetical protein
MFEDGGDNSKHRVAHGTEHLPPVYARSVDGVDYGRHIDHKACRALRGTECVCERGSRGPDSLLDKPQGLPAEIVSTKSSLRKAAREGGFSFISSNLPEPLRV